MRGLKILAIIAFVGMVLSATVVSAILVWAYLQLPKLDHIQDYRPDLGSTVYAKGGKVIGEFHDTERRYVRPIDEIPEWVINAFVAGEDGNFFEHSGVDFTGMIRAFAANMRAGRVVQGGSTITQQVSKSLLLTSERSYSRKIKEVLLAHKVEKNFTKRQILFLYLNQIYFGQRAYGVEAAARIYFKKSIKDATIAEGALLAGLVQAPSKYSPSKNPLRARERQLYVLRRMMDTGKITRDAYQNAIAEDVKIYPEEAPNLSVAPYYLEHVRQILMEKYGPEFIYKGGLTVETAADYDLSATAMKAVKSNLEELDKRQGYRGPIGHVENPEALAEEQKKVRKEIFAKKFGFNYLPLDVSKGFDESKWVDYTSGVIKKKNPELADESRYLLPGERYRAVVTRIDPDGKSAEVDIAGIKARLPLANMKWAKRIKVPETANWGQISKISEAVSGGDIILVKVLAQAAATDPLLVSLEQEPIAQSALISLEANTGFVLAMVGGYDFGTSVYNRALQGERQPGSCFKPLLYSAALDRGFTPSSIIIDSPIIFESQGNNLKWIPENNSEKFYGDTTLRTAIVNSRNVPAVKLLQEVGLGYFINFLKAIGITSELNPDLSLALGSRTITLMELTKLYALFPRLGMRVEPVFILKVTDRDGHILEEFSAKDFAQQSAQKWTKYRETLGLKSPAKAEDGSIKQDENQKTDQIKVFEDVLRGLDERTAFVMSHLLQEVVQFGTGTGAKVLKRKIGGKTGTTSEFIDAWFMGFSPEVVTGVWTGFDSPRSLGKGEVGSRAALPAWIDFMQAALEKYPQDEYIVPKGIVFVRIDPKTGVLAGPGNSSGVKEAYIEGTEPTLERQNQQTPESSDFFREDL